MSAFTGGEYFQQLTSLCAKATTSLFLAAPFVKADIVKKLVAATTDDVEVLVVTRWHPDEIVAQVSDLEVWPIVRNRAKSRLLLQQYLHAKYYRADQECLIGSANLTAAALSDSGSSNLELLVSIAASDPQLSGFEERIITESIVVDDMLHRRFCALVAELRSEPKAVVDHRVAKPDEDWHPMFRMPAELYRVYRGSDDYSAGVLEAARADLLALAPPPSLGQESFEAAIGIALQCTKLVQDLDSFLKDQERRFGEVRNWFSERIALEDEQGWATQSLIRWLLTFLPDRYVYRRPGHSELLSLRGEEQELSPDGDL